MNETLMANEHTTEQSNGQPVRLMIVDDHYMVRRGLLLIIKDFKDIEVVAEASDGDYAVSLCQEVRPEVVLMDIRMPRKDGIEATRLIRSTCPETQVIALTSFTDENEIQEILKAGAVSFLMKNVTGEELVTAIRHARIGKSTLAPEAAHVLISMTTRTSPAAPGRNLTDRELEVLALMVEGLSNREISARLIISSSTVKNHVSNILNKLGTNSRTQAVALAVEYKFFS
jgi:two-component system, NarL family, response regulator LiaR